MVDTDKVKEKEEYKINYKRLIKTWAQANIMMMIFMIVIFAVSNKSMVEHSDDIYFVLILYVILSMALLLIGEKEGPIVVIKPIVFLFAIVVPCITVASINIKTKDIASIESSGFDLVSYDSRYDVILPNDVIKQNGLTLYDTIMMSEQLRKSYPDDGFDLVLFEAVEQNGELLSITVKSNLNYRYVISINLVTKVVDTNITKSDATETKTLTEMGEPIYSFTPDEKANFEAYVTDAGFDNDTSLCSIEEKNCCWYIYFTDGGSDCYIRVDKKTNEVTEKGNVLKGERIKS